MMSRRRVVFAALTGAMLAPLSVAPQVSRRHPNPVDDLPPRDPRLLLKDREKEIRRQTEKPFEVAGELKREVETTKSSDVLSLELIQKAGEGE